MVRYEHRHCKHQRNTVACDQCMGDACPSCIQTIGDLVVCPACKRDALERKVRWHVARAGMGGDHAAAQRYSDEAARMHALVGKSTYTNA